MSASILLSHLHNPASPIPPDALQSLISSHLSQPSPTTLPTPLTASIVSSPYFSSPPFTRPKLQTLTTAFRHATHLKLRSLETRTAARPALNAAFARSTPSLLAQWFIDVVKGLQGGHPVVRLACLSGLLLAAQEEEEEKRCLSVRRDAVENELVIAFAEVVDSYYYAIEPQSEWEKEFREREDAHETLCVSLVLASQALPLADKTRLKTLPLGVINGILVSTIRQAFCDGAFLLPLTNLATEGPFEIPSLVAQDIKTQTSSLPYTSIAQLSKLTALTLELMLDTRSRKHVQQAMQTTLSTLSTLNDMAETIEAHWNRTSLPGKNVDDIESKSQEVTKDLWTIFKTFLFSTIMISQAALTTLVYIPPSLFSPSQRPTHVAVNVLSTLYHLAFIVSEFGGIAASNNFAELKRVTFLCLDILSQDPNEAEAFVKRICAPSGTGNLDPHVQRRKKAFALACFEHLVPVLSHECIKDWIWEQAYPHLPDSSNRELYESAHSVVLAMLASHASQSDVRNRHDDAIPDDFVTRIIPFYAHCLIENSSADKLSTTQLQLAYSTLVRGAAAKSYVLAWYCLCTLVKTIRDLRGATRDGAQSSQLHKLDLALIASVSSLPLSLMLPALDKARDVVFSLFDGKETKEQREELVTALFKELVEKVGEGEKEAAMRWWYDNMPYLEDTEGGGSSSVRDSQSEEQ